MKKKIILQISVALPAVFILWRQPLLNAFEVPRHLFSGLHGLVLTTVALILMVVFLARLPRLDSPRRAFLAVAWTSFFVFALVTLIYGHDLTDAQAFYGFLYYAVLPSAVLIPSTRFWQVNQPELTRVIIYIWCASFLVAVCQYFDIPLPAIFATDDSVIVKETYYGTIRVNGVFGNFVNYAFVSYLVLVVAFDRFLVKGNVQWLILALLGMFAVLMTSTRAYIGLSAFAVVFLMAHRGKIKIALSFFVIISAVLAIIAVALPEETDVVRAILFSEDRHTQESNDVRLNQLSMIATWLEQYSLSGLGPGFLLGPNENKKMWVTDGLWLMMVIELGLILSGVYMFLFGVQCFAALNLANAQKSNSVPLLRLLILSYLGVCIVNSAHAEIVSHWIFLMILGGAFGYKTDTPCRVKNKSP